MATNRTINTIPPGLLSLLAMKNMGQNPTDLLGQVQPTLELGEWFGVQDMITETREFTFTDTPGHYGVLLESGPNPLVVPLDEVWYVWNFSGFMYVPGNSAFFGNFWTSYQPQGFTNVLFLDRGAYPMDLDGFADASAVVSAGGDVRRWFKGGTTFGIGFSLLEVGAAEIPEGSYSMEFTRLKV